MKGGDDQTARLGDASELPNHPLRVWYEIQHELGPYHIEERVGKRQGHQVANLKHSVSRTCGCR